MAVSEGQVLRAVLTELAREGQRYVPAGISMRHLHVSAHDLEVLFGPGYELHPLRALVQPGQFAAQETVTFEGPKGRLEKVRIIGPVRRQSQAELSVTDAVTVGLKDIPVRMSGDLDKTPGIRVTGPAGSIELPAGAIAAARHLHLSTQQAQAFHVHDGQVVSVRVGGERGCVLERVVCRCGEGHELEFHVDTDEANACMLRNGDLVQVILPGEEIGADPSGDLPGTWDPEKIAARVVYALSGRKASPSRYRSAYSCIEAQEQPSLDGQPVLELVTEQDINLAAGNGAGYVCCAPKALVTPAASDRALQLKIEIRRVQAASGAVKAPDADSEVLELVTAGDLNTAFRDNRKELFCTADAIITPAARERIAETGIRVIRIGKEHACR